jgi:hypothetical protein
MFNYMCPNTPCIDCPYADRCDDYHVITVDDVIKILERCSEHEEE